MSIFGGGDQIAVRQALSNLPKPEYEYSAMPAGTDDRYQLSNTDIVAPFQAQVQQVKGWLEVPDAKSDA